MSLDTPIVYTERWPDHTGSTRAELLDEIRRAHTEIDGWRRCAIRWKAMFLRIEQQLGAALGEVDCG